ncbi:MAG: vWA domain-containing protein, partial [Nitrosopumilaceae archaeon]
VSQHSIYDKWRKNKTQEICWQVIDFIEDVAAEKYLSITNSDAFDNIKNINSILINKYKNNIIKSNNNTKNNFTTLYLKENKKNYDIKDKILAKRGGSEHIQNMLSCADLLYNNRKLLSSHIFPYCEHHNVEETIKLEKYSVDFKPYGLFAENVIMLEDLWNAEEENKARLLRRYKKHLRGLNFDEVIIPSGDINAYLQIKSQNNVLLRKIRDGIRMVTNIQDDPRVQEMGIINMQYAIQAIAAESNTVEIFEQDEVRRSEEAWVILIDCSASMKLKFNKMKEFALCVAETANELTGRSDAWSLYGFDSKFTIVKDFKEKYSQEVKARIGALKSGGLSFVPDAIELGNRLLTEDTRERKYLFVITDGQSSGDDTVEKRLQKLVKNIGMSEIGIIGVGIKDDLRQFFSNSCDSSNLRDMVTKFIKTYRDAAANM